MKTRSQGSQIQLSIKKAMESIKSELRRLYGVLSVNELTSNKELVFEIEVLERMLAKQGV